MIATGASTVAIMLAFRVGRGHFTDHSRKIVADIGATSLIVCLCVSFWFFLNLTGFPNAFALWSGVRRDERRAANPGVVTDLYAWTAALLPLLGAVAHHAFQVVAPDAEVSDAQVIDVYFVAYLLLCFFDARQIKRSGTARDVVLFAWVWLVPVYLWQRSRALGSRPVLLMAWIAAWRISILVFPPEMTNGVYTGGGVPACASSVSKREIEKIFQRNLAGAHSNILVLSSRRYAEIGSNANSRTCRGILDLSDTRSVAVTFTTTNHGATTEYRLLVGAQSGT